MTKKSPVKGNQEHLTLTKNISYSMHKKIHVQITGSYILRFNLTQIQVKCSKISTR